MKRLISGGIAAAAVTGTLLFAAPASAPAHSGTTPSTPTPGGGTFLPAYLAMLQGKQFPKDRCYPRDLHDLLIPCDKP